MIKVYGHYFPDPIENRIERVLSKIDKGKVNELYDAFKKHPRYNKEFDFIEIIEDDEYQYHQPIEFDKFCMRPKLYYHAEELSKTPFHKESFQSLHEKFLQIITIIKEELAELGSTTEKQEKIQQCILFINGYLVEELKDRDVIYKTNIAHIYKSGIAVIQEAFNIILTQRPNVKEIVPEVQKTLEVKKGSRKKEVCYKSLLKPKLGNITEIKNKLKNFMDVSTPELKNFLQASKSESFINWKGSRASLRYFIDELEKRKCLSFKEKWIFTSSRFKVKGEFITPQKMYETKPGQISNTDREDINAILNNIDSLK